jgi:arginine:ornithine antiporter / lysine permease
LIPLAVFIVVVAYAFQMRTFTFNFWGTGEGASLGTVLDQVKSTMLVTVWVFIGIEGASVYSSRAQNRADVGRATVIGFVVCLLLLMAVSLLSMGILSQPELAALKNPSMAPVLEKVVGTWGALLVYVGIIISVGGGFLAWTLLAAESLFIPAKDGVMPRWLTRQNAQGVPANALWLTSSMVQLFLLLTLVSNASYLALISLSTAMILVPYLFSAAYGVRVARQAKTGADLPIAALATVYCLWLLVAAGPKYLLLSALLYAPGAALFVWAKREQRQTVFTRAEKAILAALLLVAASAGFMLATGRLAL